MKTTLACAAVILCIAGAVPWLAGNLVGTERTQRTETEPNQAVANRSALRAGGQSHVFVQLASSDLVQHDISTQDVCEEVTAPPSRDDRWYRNLSLNVDNEILGGDIVAYKIQWFNGGWSGWFVPGVNDIDGKVNRSNQAQPNTMRRRWSCFYDHKHRYLIVRPRSHDEDVANVENEEVENLVLNPSADMGAAHWTPDGNCKVEDGCFVVREQGHFHQDIRLPPEAVGKFVLLIGRTASERINADGSITGLPYLYGYLMGSDSRIQVYMQGREMRCNATEPNQWTKTWGVFAVPDGVDRVRFFLNQASRKGDPSTGSAARFDDVGVHLFDTEQDARDYVSRLRMTATETL